MDAIEALLTRNSVAQLTEPAPTDQQLDIILHAGLRANDHRRLRPWKFLIIDGDARAKLGQLMLQISLQDNPQLPEDKQRDIADKPLRAPLIIAVVAKVRDNEKVPNIEQQLSTAGAAQLMMLAAHAQGIGAIWRSGSLSHDSRMVSGLGLDSRDKIIGFLYMGTPKAIKPLASMDAENFTERWNGQ